MTDTAFCPQCGAAKLVGAAFCGTCGRQWDTPEPWPNQSTATPALPVAPAGPVGWVTPPRPSSSHRARNLLLFALVAGGLYVGSSVLGVSEAPARTPAYEPPVVNTWTPPTGFETTTQDATVAVQWGSGCDASFEGCWVLDVVTKDGCSTLYVELSVMDASGTAIGYTNDVLTGLAAGQRGKMTFQATDSGAQKARVSDVSCH